MTRSSPLDQPLDSPVPPPSLIAPGASAWHCLSKQPLILDKRAAGERIAPATDGKRDDGQPAVRVYTWDTNGASGHVRGVDWFHLRGGKIAQKFGYLET